MRAKILLLIWISVACQPVTDPNNNVDHSLSNIQYSDQRTNTPSDTTQDTPHPLINAPYFPKVILPTGTVPVNPTVNPIPKSPKNIGACDLEPGEYHLTSKTTCSNGFIWCEGNHVEHSCNPTVILRYWGTISPGCNPSTVVNTTCSGATCNGYEALTNTHETLVVTSPTTYTKTLGEANCQSTFSK